MIEADVLFIKDDKFYDQKDTNGNKITGYELFFRLINDFKNKFNYSIHTYHESNDTIQFSFKGDYIANLKKYNKGRYVELYSSGDNIDDFVEKFNYLKDKISEMNIL